MAVLHSPENAESKERVKWEAQMSAFGPGLRPYEYRPYPMMMHLAGPPSGGMGAITIVDCVTVGSDMEAAVYHQRGFRPTPLEALDAYEAQQLEFAKLAAEQNHDVKHKLSAKAGAEVLAAQNAYPGHLPSVPETPIKKNRGRKPKAHAQEETH